MQTRSLKHSPTVDPANPYRVRGYFARFNETSRQIAERGQTFRESILPGAFAATLRSPPAGDVVALWNHGTDGRPPLGRTGSGTLRLWEDAQGLAFELDLPHSAADVREAVARGDVWGGSFGMRNERARWSTRDGGPFREVAALDLVEVSLVIHPAYPTAGVRAAGTAVEVPDLYPMDLAAARLALAAAGG